jgi:GTP-binding protein
VVGAREGVGLGHEFLAHLERARLFLHVIDATEDCDERFRVIDRELAAYGAGLADRPQLVVLNKIDLEPTPSFAVDDPRIAAVVRVSAATGAGIDELVRSLFAFVPAAATGPAPRVGVGELVEHLVYRPQSSRRRPFRIFRTDRGYRVTGRGVDFEDETLHAALREAGARPGDAVEVGDEIYEYA